MDLQNIQDQLNTEFSKEDTRIIFWFDDKGEYEDEVSELQLDNAKLHILDGANWFYSKWLLNESDTESKSYIYEQISPNSILVAGGQTTVANLFYNMSNHTVGLVGMWDCVAFDEVAGIKFKDKDGIQIMKGYMASGAFSRGKAEIQASSLLFNVLLALMQKNMLERTNSNISWYSISFRLSPAMRQRKRRFTVY